MFVRYDGKGKDRRLVERLLRCVVLEEKFVVAVGKSPPSRLLKKRDMQVLWVLIVVENNSP